MGLYLNMIIYKHEEYPQARKTGVDAVHEGGKKDALFKRANLKKSFFSVVLVCNEELNLMLKVIGLLVKVRWV